MTPGVFPVKSEPGKAVSYSDSFGAPRSGGRQHLGVDIFAAEGTPVLAVEAGTALAVEGELTGIGVRLDVADGRYQYAHLLDRAGKFPRRVEVGDVLGWVGTTGNAKGTPPHLHFEVRLSDGSALNPVQFLERLQNPALIPPAPLVRVPVAPLPRNRSPSAQGAGGLVAAWLLYQLVNELGGRDG